MVDTVKPEHFKLTVAVPAEMGTMRGFHVEKLAVPGRLGYVSVGVTKGTRSSSSAARVSVETTNILEFSIDPKLFRVLSGQDKELWIDGDQMRLDPKAIEAGKIIYFKAMDSRVWKVCLCIFFYFPTF